MKAHGAQYILVGFLLVVTGALIPFLMILGVIGASFLLSFLAYSASVVGLSLGFFGAFDIRQDELDK